MLRTRHHAAGIRNFKVYGDAQESPQTEAYWGNVNCHGERLRMSAFRPDHVVVLAQYFGVKFSNV